MAEEEAVGLLWVRFGGRRTAVADLGTEPLTTMGSDTLPEPPLAPPSGGGTAPPTPSFSRAAAGAPVHAAPRAAPPLRPRLPLPQSCARSAREWIRATRT